MSVEEAGRKGDQKGGRKTAETHGRKFYEEIGSKSGHRVRELIREGKEHGEE
jgi:general stress protein YciG